MTTRVVRLDTLSPKELDDYLARGWFRIGQTLMTCRVVLFDGALRTALWTRLPLQGHRFRKSSRKLLSRIRRRFRVEVRTEAALDLAHEDLYQRYRAVARGERSPSLEDFLHGDAEQPRDLFDTREVDLWDGDRLVAFSWFDLGHRAAQSLMGVYDPEYASHSLGFTTMLLEIEYAMERGLNWFYPGYVLPGEPAMDYKLRIGEVEFHDADLDRWRPWPQMDASQLAEARMRRALKAAANAMAARGLRVVLRMYPMFEAPAWHDQLSSCLDAPLVLVCDPRPLARRQTLVTYDLQTDTYEVVRCARASAVAVTHDGDVGRPIELWLVEDRLLTCVDPQSVALEVARLEPHRS
ncbi:MAG: GNAT family N-acetyltransferase [Myxococcales bacterium]|nr:GNAT family N-acetyltransferase [Myxococcales bacterium]